MTSDSALLSVERFSVAYAGKMVVSDVELQVSTRQMVALLGPNGAGKSTLLRGLYGLLRERSGPLTFAGLDISENSARQNIEAGVGYVPQGAPTFPDLTVDENLKLCSVRGGATARSHERIFEVFPALRPRRRQRARSLSGGEKQMLAIGMGLIPRPKLLLVDEPSIGLAPAVADQVFRTLKAVNSDAGTAMLIVEQSVDRALEVSGYAYVMRAGRIVYQGRPQDVDIDAIVSRGDQQRQPEIPVAREEIGRAE